MNILRRKTQGWAQVKLRPDIALGQFPSQTPLFLSFGDDSFGKIKYCKYASIFSVLT